jgi:hypothetical protein
VGYFHGQVKTCLFRGLLPNLGEARLGADHHNAGLLRAAAGRIRLDGAVAKLALTERQHGRRLGPQSRAVTAHGVLLATGSEHGVLSGWTPRDSAQVP